MKSVSPPPPVVVECCRSYFRQSWALALIQSEQRLCCHQNQTVCWIAAVYRLSSLLSPPETRFVGFRTVIWRVSGAGVI